MTTIQLIELLRPLLGFEGEPGDELSWKIDQAVPTALKALARLVADDDSLRHLLTKVFTVAITAGQGSLATHLTATEPLLLDKLGKATIYLDGLIFPVTLAPDRAYLSLDTSSRPFVAVEDQVLYVKGEDGLTGTYTGDAALSSASYVPLLSSLPVSLNDKFVPLVAGMLMPAASRRSKQAQPSVGG
jgi:hypothetical protein